ncbi:MAG: DUF2147 domain-containing protein [Rhizobium sp.]|nr:MAG: DUF2147 domain-containing protein [Rhizobium sp.]
MLEDAKPQGGLSIKPVIGAFTCLLIAMPMAKAAGVEGLWARGDGNARVRVAPCGSDICAINTWIKPGTSSEKAGDKLIMTIKPDADGRYVGNAFDPQRDLNYRITLTVSGDRMTTRGCIIAGLICKGVDWTRIH